MHHSNIAMILVSNDSRIFSWCLICKFYTQESNNLYNSHLVFDNKLHPVKISHYTVVTVTLLPEDYNLHKKYSIASINLSA